MQGSNPRGSFGIPLDLQKKMDDAAKQARSSKSEQLSTPTPPVESEANEISTVDSDIKKIEEPVKSKEELEREEFEKLKSNYETTLKTTITEQDVTDYIFKGFMTKEVEVIPGKLKATFKTLSADQLQEMRKRVDPFVKTTGDAQAIANENTLWTLSYVVVKLSGRDLPTDVVKKREVIGKLATNLIGKLSVSWNTLDMLINFSLEEERFLKKS